MEFGIKDLQVVILDNVKGIWSNSLVRTLFNDTLQLKFDGYDKQYGHNVISADKVDFFGTHVIVCLKKELDLKPIFAFKSVTLERCKAYLHQFPIESLLKSDASFLIQNKLDKLLLDIYKKSESISYESSLVQCPSLREKKSIKIKELIHELTMMLAVSYHETFQIEHMLACGVIDVKTNLFFEKMGLEYLVENYSFQQSDINKHLVSLMYTNKFSLDAYECAKKHKELWENRIVFSGDKEFLIQNHKKYKIIA